MMMHCLARSSGLPLLTREIERPIWGPDHDPDYEPNPNGYYETEPPWPVEQDEPWAHLVDGYLFKLDAEWLLGLLPGPGYLVLLMQRDRDEVRRSHLRSFGSAIDERTFDDYERARSALVARPDVTLTVLSYADVIANPLAVFTNLKAGGWPIDAERAASLVVPDLYRNRS